MAKYAINYNGLKLKPSYDSLVHTIADQPRIIYPNRQAMQLRDSPYMTQLMNSAGIQEQQARLQMEQVKKAAVTQAATNTGGTRAMMEATEPSQPVPPPAAPEASPPDPQTPFRGGPIGSDTSSVGPSPSGYDSVRSQPSPLARVPDFPVHTSV